MNISWDVEVCSLCSRGTQRTTQRNGQAWEKEENPRERRAQSSPHTKDVSAKGSTGNETDSVATGPGFSGLFILFRMQLREERIL